MSLKLPYYLLILYTYLGTTTFEKLLFFFRLPDLTEFQMSQLKNETKTFVMTKNELKGGYPIIFASNVFRNSHLIHKCIQN